MLNMALDVERKLSDVDILVSPRTRPFPINPLGRPLIKMRTRRKISLVKRTKIDK